MRQLAGVACVICRNRIPGDLDGRFCAACGCPVHNGCARPGATGDGPPRCPMCGAATTDAPREQVLHRQHEERGDGSRAADPGRRNPRVWLAGLVGSGIMTVTAANATLNPARDGRLLNTVPALGFDIFLPIGLIGLAFFGFRWLMSR